jgi:hypothetical protein
MPFPRTVLASGVLAAMSAIAATPDVVMLPGLDENGTVPTGHRHREVRPCVRATQVFRFLPDAEYLP